MTLHRCKRARYTLHVSPSLILPVHSPARRSVVDSTGVQILRDTKEEAKRWTGYTIDVRSPDSGRTSKNAIDASLPRQFHFANIHRADVHNVLVAGGFGTPPPPLRPTFFPPEPLVLRETVPVNVNYGGYRNGTAESVPRGGTYSDSPSDQGRGYAQEPIISESTPFFHVDLIAAVRAAEDLGLKEEEEQSERGPGGSSQGNILIDLQN